MTPHDGERLRYIAPLDGLRAVAILGVLLFHVCPTALRGGFAGVDVFFVLSGFLITSIILSDLRARCFSLLEFYLRRIQRLWPNIVVTVLAVLVLWAYFLPAGSVVQPARHGLWTLFNLSNIYVWKELGGYWDAAAESAPLTHTWSLGIEEQFYLLFPSCLMLLGRFQHRCVLIWLLIVAAASFGLGLYGTYTHSTATFYLLPTRVWELLLGAIIAAQRIRTGGADGNLIALGPRSLVWVGWCGLLLIFAGFAGIDERDGFPGFVALAPTLGCALVLLSVVDGETAVSRLLSTPFMIGVGKRSYSLYLWHWPLIIFGKIQAELHGWPLIAGAIAGGIGGVLLGWVVYEGIERPLRDRGAGRGWRLVATGVAFATVAACCLAAMLRRPVVDPSHRFDPLKFSVKLYDAGRPGASDFSMTARYLDVNIPTPLGGSTDAWRNGGIIHRFGGVRPAVVVLGSSHALMYSRLIDDLCCARKLSVAFLALDGGVPAFFETAPGLNFSSPRGAREFDEARKHWLREWRPKVVFIIDRWDTQVRRTPGFDERLRSFLREVSPWVGHIVFVSQVPVVKAGENVNLRGLVSWMMGAGNTLPRLEPDASEGLRRQAITVAEAAMKDFPRFSVLRVDRLFYRVDKSVRYADGRVFYYADDNHLSDAGANVARELFEGALNQERADVDADR